jgi:PhnB protein
LIAEISDETLAAAATSYGWLRQSRGTVQPYLRGTHGLIEFVKLVFGARDLDRFDLSPSAARVDVTIEGGPVVLEVSDPPTASAVPGSVYVYVRDVDAVYSKALENGAEEIAPPEDMPYGERVAGVRDAFGNTWWIATYTAP